MFHFLPDPFPQCLKIFTEKTESLEDLLHCHTCRMTSHNSLTAPDVVFFFRVMLACLFHPKAHGKLRQGEKNPIQADGKAAVSKGEREK